MRHVFGVHAGRATLNFHPILVRFRFRRQLTEWIEQDRENRKAVDSRHPYVRLAQRQPEAWEDNTMRISDE